MADRTKEIVPGTLQGFRRQFGRRLAALRKERGMTQEQLARALKMDPVFVAYLESAQKSPSFNTIYNLARVLEVVPAKLF